MRQAQDIQQKETVDLLNKCFAYAGVKRLGVIDHYECGVLYRIQCWLDALGIKHRFTPEIGRCHMHATGSCAGEVHLLFPDENPNKEEAL